jgi:hypothetical protein
VKNSIYKQLSTLTNDYFESGSQQFLDDLIVHHLNIDPKQLKSKQLKTILDWLEIAANLLINDQKSSKSYMTKVRYLSELN